VVYSCKYHIVWCPKFRRSVLVNGVDKRLKEIIQQTAAEFQATVIELEIMPDHVHLLWRSRPAVWVHRLVRYLKGRSSRLLRQEFPWLRSRLPTLWTHSYFVSTVGGAPLSIIKQYIENQKKRLNGPRKKRLFHLRSAAQGHPCGRARIAHPAGVRPHGLQRLFGGEPAAFETVARVAGLARRQGAAKGDTRLGSGEEAYRGFPQSQ